LAKARRCLRISGRLVASAPLSLVAYEAEQLLLASEQQEAESTTTVSTHLVTLDKARGGGWEATFPAAADDAVKRPLRGLKSGRRSAPEQARGEAPAT
jgi:hypothetical protein